MKTTNLTPPLSDWRNFDHLNVKGRIWDLGDYQVAEAAPPGYVSQLVVSICKEIEQKHQEDARREASLSERVKRIARSAFPWRISITRGPVE